MREPRWVSAVEGWLGVQRRWRGINRFPEPRAYFDDGGVPAAERVCARANADLLGFIRPPEPCEPNRVARRRVSRRPGGIVGEEWSFDSPRPSGDRANDRVRLRVYRHRDCPEDRRAVVFHHPIYQRDWGIWVWFLTPLLRRVPVAMMAAPHHFERAGSARYPGERTMNPNPARLFEAIRQWAADHVAAVRLLDSHAGLEARAVVGYSFGAFQILLLASSGGIDVPIVSIASTNRYAFGLYNGVLGNGVLEGMARVGIDRDRLDRMVESLQLERHVGALAAHPVLFVHGAHDGVDPHPSGDRLCAALRPDRTLTLDAGHGTLVFLRDRIFDATLDFLATHGAVEDLGGNSGTTETSPLAS